MRCDGGLRNISSNVGKVIRLLSGPDFQVVHVFTGASTLFGAMTLLLARATGRRGYMSVFGREDVEIPSRVGRSLFVFSAAIASGVLTNSQATRSLLPVWIAHKAQVLLGGAETPSVLKSGVAEMPDSVLFVGRLVRRKGVDDLIAAMQKVTRDVPRARLVIVGDGPERRNLQEVVSRLNLGSSVEFTGTLKGAALQKEYEKCELCVLPSKHVADDPATEGLGLSLIEAAASGKPIIGTRHGGIPEIVRDGVTGFLVSEGDPDALADAILKLLKNKELSRSMGDAANRDARTRLTWEEATRRLLKAYVS